MTTPTDPTALETPENGHSGPQDALNTHGGQREAREGENGAQTGAQSFEHSVAAAEKRLRLAHQARRAKEHQLDDIRRALCDIGFMHDDDPYSHADLADVIRQNGQALHDATPPTHNAGPSIREAAADDRRWWTDKYAGEQP
ncbi:hypothetical protein ACIG0D_27420 [Streptomyces sp. NPDC052773]|uniref:hypothetical protein n=1 Tax=Streptomyces sp. NPDC052773 TaxID=3365693 RepID=UPI0037D3814A